MMVVTTAIKTAASLLVALGVFMPALPGSDLSAAELPDLEVKDLWDYPESLRAIVARGTTLFFICDPGVKECREGAVFIENRASSIREAGLRPVLLLRSSGPDVRSAALEMDLDTPIYIDEDGHVIGSMLSQDVLPALLLASPDGTIIDTVYGGGESLAGNLEQILMRETPEPPPPVVAEPEKESKGTWKLVAGIAALALIGLLIFAD
jgi:hypothetical protein